MNKHPCVREGTCCPWDRWGLNRSLQAPLVCSTGYFWIVLLSTFDVVATWFVLAQGGAELNHVAAAVIEWGGLGGTLVFKFTLVAVAIILCEEVARRNRRTGRRLCRVLVVLAAIPLIAIVLQAWMVYLYGV